MMNKNKAVVNQTLKAAGLHIIELVDSGTLDDDNSISLANNIRNIMNDDIHIVPLYDLKCDNLLLDIITLLSSCANKDVMKTMCDTVSFIIGDMVSDCHKITKFTCDGLSIYVSINNKLLGSYLHYCNLIQVYDTINNYIDSTDPDMYFKSL